MNTLEITDLRKKFGSLTALDGLSFSVPERTVFGLIGPNGAGKTTTMKMILGFLAQDAGTISVDGIPVVYGGARTNRRIGYLPDVPEFYGYMTPREYLRFCGEIADLPPRKIRERSEQLLSLVGIREANRRIAGFSRGMKQRLGIAQALLAEPKLLICDGPTSALDPVGRKEVLDILAAAADETTILFSTHILADVERISDRIGILNRGRLALTGDLETVKSRYRRNKVLLEVADESQAERLEGTLRKIPGISDLSRDGRNLTVQIKEEPGIASAVLHAAADSDLSLLRYEVAEKTLEDVFLEVIE